MFNSKLSSVRSLNGELSSVSASNAPGYVPIPCPTHPDYTITNICKTPKCVQPLCPECITHHVELHQQTKTASKIQNIVSTRLTCIEQLAKMKYQAQKQFQEMMEESSGNIEEFVESNYRKIQIAHNKLVKLIDEQFSKLNKKMNAIGIAFSNEKQKRRREAVIRFSPLKEYVNKIAEYKEDLESDDYIPTLIELLNEPPKKPKIEGLAEIMKMGEVEINQKYFEQIRSGVENWVKIKSELKEEFLRDVKEKNSLKFSRLDRSISRQNQKNNSVHSSRVSAQNSRIQFSRPQNYKNQVQTLRAHSEVIFNKKEQPLKIFKNHYFTALKHTNLVTFQEGTKHGFAANLQYLQGGFSKFDLNIDFNLPYDHHTVITPAGDVFLIGGQTAEGISGKTGVSSKFYKLVDSKLQELTPMNQSRAKFGACYLNSMIFCFGGVTTVRASQRRYQSISATESCEVYDLDRGRWLSIPPMPEAVYNLQVCPISKDRIAKLGGTRESGQRLHAIDIYSLEASQWSRFEANNIEIPYQAGIANISEGQILIFGGFIEAGMNHKTTKAYILSQTSNANLEIRPTKELYNEAIFQNTYILNGFIITIQNGQTGSNKVIMAYKHDQWKFISC